jgi:hypothetical protein
MPSVRAVVVAIAIAGAGLAAVALLQRTSLAFTPGVVPAAPVVALGPGRQACQRPLDVPGGGGFDSVSLVLGGIRGPGSPATVAVRAADGRPLAGGRVAGGYGARSEQRVDLGRIVAPGRIEVCVRNDGRRRLAVFGNVDAAARTSSAARDGRPLHADLALVLERAPRSIASEVPDMLSRAALFRFPWMGAWTYVLLAALLCVVAPWLLVRAATAAAAEDAAAAERDDASPR